MENENLDSLLDIDDNTKLDRRILKQFFDKAHPDLKFATFSVEGINLPGEDIVRDINIEYSISSDYEFLGKFRAYGTIWCGAEQKLIDLSPPERIV
jgi:hypothetical protein